MSDRSKKVEQKIKSELRDVAGEDFISKNDELISLFLQIAYQTMDTRYNDQLSEIVNRSGYSDEIKNKWKSRLKLHATRLFGYSLIQAIKEADKQKLEVSKNNTLMQDAALSILDAVVRLVKENTDKLKKKTIPQDLIDRAYQIGNMSIDLELLKDESEIKPSPSNREPDNPQENLLQSFTNFIQCFIKPDS